MIEIGLIALIGLAGLSLVWFTLKSGISPMPSSRKARRAILKASEAAGEGSIIELGSGWGGLLFALARKYPERQVIGYELSWLPWAFSHLCKTLYRLHKVDIHRQNFLAADISAASLLVCYLFPKGMIDLQKKLTEEGSNALLISSTFALPGCEPMQVSYLDDLYNTPIYVYAEQHPGERTTPHMH